MEEAGSRAFPYAPGRCYLEMVELACDWLEAVVAALSCEKPLWLDSRLVMEPLE